MRENTTQTGVDDAACADFDADAPMAGTADPFDVLLLLEYRGVWTDRVVTQAVLPPRLRAWLDRITSELEASGRRVKIMFIKQLGGDSDRDNHLFVASEQSCGALRLPVLAALSELTFEQLQQRLSPVVEPHYFVCCNGQRDVCCARLGLPLYRALRDTVSARAWQISHVGGHRFAPNVLTLPSGALYGRVSGEALPQFLRLVEAGKLDFDRLRGRSWLSKTEQAGEAYLADGRRRPDGVRVEGERSLLRYGETELVVEPGDERTVIASCGKEQSTVRPLQVTLGS